MAEFRLETPRLVLRSWREADLDAFAAMSADPRVMATLGPVMARDEAQALIARVDAIEREHGHTFWALERREDGATIGWCGLVPGTAGPVEGKAEIGWRLAHQAWGQGFASEAAAATLDWGFANLAEDRIWAITALSNHRSQAVMARLGMHRHPDLDFDHPKVPAGDPLKPHVTFSIARSDWLQRH